MQVRRLFALIVLISMVPLTPVTYAVPIDPSFPGGLYNNSDLDDVFERITSKIAASDICPTPRVLHVLVPAVVACVHEPESPRRPQAIRASSPGRAPPSVA